MADVLSILAFETLDCASKVRIHYRVPSPLTPDLLSLFPDAVVSINRFSALVAGAQDHFSIQRPGRFHAGGALGGLHLTVTYGKSRGERPQAEIAEFEASLERGGLGVIRRPQPQHDDVMSSSLQ
ncbi:MAG TPA: hypothetical protein VGE37_16460 [Archangium sp.]